jgi:AcrR family transcriptional regulator
MKKWPHKKTMMSLVARAARGVKTRHRQSRTAYGYCADAVCPPGIAHTSLNAIAKEAGVTPAMLHYYFSSREALVDQLLEERFMPLRSEIGQIFIDHPQDPVTAFTLLIEALGTLAEKHTWFAPLWMQEVIGEMPILRQHMHARFGDDKYHRMLTTVKRWQEEGKLNPALSPELLFTTLISLVLVPFSRLRSDTRLTSVTRQTIVSHALTLIRRGIAG